ncbi:hypothetical protein P9112_009773 [Eukaryota sp. TZLM1-RC]
MSNQKDIVETLLECLELRYGAEHESATLSDDYYSEEDIPFSQHLYDDHHYTKPDSTSPLTQSGNWKSPIRRLRGLGPPERSSTSSHRPKSARSIKSPSARSTSVLYPKKPSTLTPPKRDPVSRYHAMAKKWSEDPFLRRKSQRPKRPKIPVLATSAPNYRIKSHPRAPSEFTVPTTKRRDGLRWAVRSSLNKGDC